MEGDKKILLGLILILSFNLISSYTTIENRDDCSNPIMGLYSLINAHGEVFSEANYNYVLCANYSGNHSCDGTNKIIGFYSNTNAHAEIPSLENYPIDVCYEDMSCETKSLCLPGEEEVLSLYADTNSHLGEPGTYGKKICCTFDGSVGLPGECKFNTAVWNPLGPVEEDAFVEMRISFTGTCVGKHISITISELDTFSSDDLITTIPNIEISGGVVQAWAAIWEKDEFLEFDDDPEYKFKAWIVEDSIKTIESETELEVTKHSTIPLDCSTSHDFCGNYTTKNYCELDECSVGNSTLIDGLCTTTTQCVWNESSSICNKQGEPICDLGGTLGSISIGTCDYEENTEDDCEDGYLTYNWVGIWAWSPENNFTEAEVNGREGFLFLDGEWRYDPNLDNAECDEGSNLLACPAHIELSFFNWINVIIIILIIGLVYYFLNKKPSKINSKNVKKNKIKK